MPRVSRRHDAVKEINAARDSLNDVRRRADTHEITGLVPRHIGVKRLNNIVHDLRALPYGQTADGIARQIQLGDLLHMADAQVGIGASLVDAPEHLPGIHGVLQLVQTGIFRLAAHQPAVGSANGILHIFVRRRVLDALVKSHADIGAQIGLNLHALLRAHENLVPVNVGGKVDALLLDFSQTGQRKHLKAAGIREDRLAPGHEFVQAAHIVHKPVARP